MGILYENGKTRAVCRSCGSKYEDFYFADISDDCNDCGVTSGHCGFTNIEKIEDDNGHSS